MASVTLRVHYTTHEGERLVLERLLGEERGDAPDREVLPMRHDGDGFWSVQLADVSLGSAVRYRYEFRASSGWSRREPEDRRVEVIADSQMVWDHFFAPELPDGAFLRQTFAGVIFNPTREAALPLPSPDRRRLRLTIRAPRVRAGHRLCLSGDHVLLGDWEPSKARVMSGVNYPLWELDVPAGAFERPVEFKFGIWDERGARLVQWEEGPNRIFHGVPPGPEALTVNFEHYRHANTWRGAGVAIPVFSLRTERGYGVGEFADLALFAEWAAGCDLHLVQLLPVNDTSSDFSWRDSYPYKAISTAALHPIYLNVERVFMDCRVPLPVEYPERRVTLNGLPQLDYEQVLNDKLAYLRQLFAQVGTAAVRTRAFQSYLRENGHWLRPYAAFCRLRDIHGTADFTQWGEHAVYRVREIKSWFKEGSPQYDAVMFYCWVQGHLERQLAEALAAGRALGVAFKGDLPIGIDRSSVEVWTEPELFRMDRQTGAPPDAFAVLGQNWGFPTYNWARMEADRYAWWRRRFHRMSTVFDALRVDHILGFFRIWEIPRCYQEGILGHYNPALPLSVAELAQAGFSRNPKRFTVGTVSVGGWGELLARAAPKVVGELLEQNGKGFCRLRPQFATLQARKDWYANSLSPSEAEDVEAGVVRLGYEVLFLEDPDQRGGLHPRINLADTALFRSLSSEEQAALRRIHDDYFHRRHTEFWAKEAMKKLPVLMDASPMLICGEDLGMVPDSVPMVLARLGLLSLEVQRWPKTPARRFGNPADYPYLSVCTTSTHDMSTIRGWWAEEPDTRQRFWTEMLQREGTAPAECPADICRSIVEQNLRGASMWCILPLQDWLGIDARLRHPVAAEERINVPAIPRHYWRYRMHLTVEALRQADTFNRSVRELVEAAGREVAD